MKTLSIKAEKWGSQAGSFLEPACTADYTVNDLEKDVDADSCSLFNIYDADIHVGSMVLRMEQHASYKELVVVALGGSCSGGSLIQAINEFWDHIAKKSGAKTIRAHVSKKGMARLMERAGGKLVEYVYKREVV